MSYTRREDRQLLLREPTGVARYWDEPLTAPFLALKSMLVCECSSGVQRFVNVALDFRHCASRLAIYCSNFKRCSLIHARLSINASRTASALIISWAATAAPSSGQTRGPCRRTAVLLPAVFVVSSPNNQFAGRTS